MDTRHEPPGSTTNPSSTTTPPTAPTLHKHQELVKIGEKSVMIWNFVVSIRMLKAKRFTADDTLVFFLAIERALDLGSEYDDGFLLVNARTAGYHMQYSTKSGSFDLADYSKTELPQTSTRQLELSFSFFSPYEHFWSASLPIPSLQDACKSFNGKCFPDSF